ncbi:class II fructose-bisphosphate aldolase [Streptomyces albogriseolus]|uniref:class II fructose-bisphosphate aldolase n=1 Tax=Streptomyces albogriseolus TaxID=1887 RepID=UPI0036F03A09
MTDIRRALEGPCAIPAFNFNDEHDLRGVIEGLEGANSAGILMLTPRAISYGSIEFYFDMFDFYRRRMPGRLFIELDHCSEMAIIVQAAELGFDLVMADFSALPFEDNIRMTAAAVTEVRHTKCLVEGEVDRIVEISDTGESRLSVVPATSVSQAAEFCARTGVDLVAPNIGTYHGLRRNPPEPDFAAICTLSQKIPCPLVAHGCDFLSVGTLSRMAAAGIRKLNFGPQLRISYIEAGARHFSSVAATSCDQRPIMRQVRNELRDLVSELIAAVEVKTEPS